MVDQPTPLPEELAELEETDPRTIGPFQVIGRLGAGGMGVVYGALDGTGKCVAVKVIHPSFAEQPDYRERFEREVDLLRGLDAECAPDFLGANPRAEHPWMATEFVAGRTLSEHVREFGPLTGSALRAFVAGSAEAIAAIHDADVIHRDIKPSNVMMSPHGPKILDFGIARAATESPTERGVHGTPGYLPPERLTGSPSSTAGDVFAWGGMVVFAATGRHPFGGGGGQEVLRRVRSGEHDLSGVPEDLRVLVVRALSPDPAQRPTIQEAFRASLHLIAPAPETLSPAQFDTTPATRQERGRLASALEQVWTGFDAAGHDSRAWSALGAAMGGTASTAGLVALMEGGATVKGSGVATTTMSGGQIGGMTGAGASATGLSLTAKTAIGFGAVVVAGAMTAGGVALISDSEDPENSATEQSEPGGGDGGDDGVDEGEDEGEDEVAPETTDYRGMTLPVPDGWSAFHRSDDFTTADGRQAGTDDWLVLVPEVAPGCDEEADWDWAGDVDACPHIAVLGPAAIELGWVDPSIGFHAGSEIEQCPSVATAEAGTNAVEEADLGGREAEHHQIDFPCMDDLTPLSYTQDVWYVASENILIIDRWGNPDLPAILADTT